MIVWVFTTQSFVKKKMFHSPKRRKLTLAPPTLTFKDLPPELILFEILPYFQLKLTKITDPYICFGKFKRCIGWLNKPIAIFRSVWWEGAMKWVIPLDLVSIKVWNCDALTTAPQELPSCKEFEVIRCPGPLGKPKLPKDCKII